MAALSRQPEVNDLRVYMPTPQRRPGGRFASG